MSGEITSVNYDGRVFVYVCVCYDANWRIGIIDDVSKMKSLIKIIII